MVLPPALKPGDPAPLSGIYVACDPFGVATSQTAFVSKNQALPRTSLGFRWRLMQSAEGQDDARGTAGKAPRGFGAPEQPR